MNLANDHRLPSRPTTALLFTVALLGAGACARNKEPALLTLDQVEARLGQSRFLVLDCNPQDIYDKGHVPGARWLDYKNVTPADLPSDKDTTLVFYCANEH